MTVQKMSQMTDHTTPIASLPDRILEKTGLEAHIGIGEEKKETNLVPKFKPSNLSDDDVKHYTGFFSLYGLLSYIIIIHNGDIDNLKTSETTLTWFEQWFLYFEYVWGRESITLEGMAKRYGVSRRNVGRILLYCNNKVLVTLTS